MLFSITVLLYFILIQLLANNTKYYINKGLPYFVIFLSFIILNIFRVYCQSFFPDIPNYRILFETNQPISSIIKYGYQKSDVEIGFRVLITFFKIFSSNFGLFLFFISTIQLSIFYFFCKRYKISLVNAFPIYISLTYLTFQIGMLRQALAFCFFLLALVYINRKTLYLIFILLGFTFHKSILFCILFLWSDRFINRKVLYAVFFGSVVIYLLRINIIYDIIYLFGMGHITEKGRIAYYLWVHRPDNYLGIGFWERIILLILMNLAYADLLIKNKINKYNNLIYNLGISVILLQMIFFSTPTITSRLRYYIVIFPIIFLTEYVYSEQKNRLKWLYQSFIFIYLLMYLSFLSTYLH
ncbi:MAG: EpsG family protein [Tenuifilaceae bacterium]